MKSRKRKYRGPGENRIGSEVVLAEEGDGVGVGTKNSVENPLTY